MTDSHNVDDGKPGKSVYWHREVPPLDAEAVAEHTVEATSGRVPGTIIHRGVPSRVWIQLSRVTKNWAPERALDTPSESHA